MSKLRILLLLLFVSIIIGTSNIVIFAEKNLLGRKKINDVITKSRPNIVTSSGYPWEWCCRHKDHTGVDVDARCDNTSLTF